MISTKIEVLDYIKTVTIDYQGDNLSNYSATTTSSRLSISRTLASQYLNDLHKEGRIIKINSRPVLFLHKEVLEKRYQTKLRLHEYLSIEELFLELDNCTKKLAFDDIIGATGSLKQIIDQCKASIAYPPYGLPILLYGEKGAGKETITKSIYLYATQEGIIAKGAQLIRYEVFKDDSDQHFVESLTSEGGVIEQSKHGILCIKNVQYLSSKNRAFLNEIMAHRFYLRDEAKVLISCRFILETDDTSMMSLMEDLSFTIPTICQIPSFCVRYTEEKEALILKFFKEETVRISKDIFINDTTIRILASHEFEAGILGVQRVIQTICANANADTKDEVVYVYIYHFPKEILMKKDLSEIDTVNSLEFKSVSNLKISDDVERVLEYYNAILMETYTSNKELATNSSDRVKLSQNNFISYFDYLLFERKFEQSRLKSLEHSVSEIIKNITQYYSINMPVNTMTILSRMIYLLRDNNPQLKRWNEMNKNNIQKSLNHLEQFYENEFNIATILEQNILNYTGTKLDDINRLILVMDLCNYAQDISLQKYMGIIAAHGHTTASSIANTVNTLLEHFVFDAIDMPLDVSVEAIVEKLETHINRNSFSNDIIVLVDMGSLEDIGNKINIQRPRNVAVINNVSTRLALEIGNRMLNDFTLENIMKLTVEGHSVTYRIIENKIMQDVIIFTSENGIAMANRMVSLFVRSLPRSIDVDVIAIDYEELKRVKSNYQIEGKNILFISGTSNPKVEKMVFLNLEDLIGVDDFHTIHQSLKKYLTIQEIDAFNKNFAVNFSLQNVMSHLTILEPVRLMEFVREFVDELQLKMSHYFSGRTIIGMYIHISCMIERLVTKDPIYARENLNQFRIEQEAFIELVHHCFKSIADHYSISIPDSEASYLYDYISTDKEVVTENEKNGAFYD